MGSRLIPLACGVGVGEVTAGVEGAALPHC